MRSRRETTDSSPFMQLSPRKQMRQQKHNQLRKLLESSSLSPPMEEEEEHDDENDDCECEDYTNNSDDDDEKNEHVQRRTREKKSEKRNSKQLSRREKHKKERSASLKDVFMDHNDDDVDDNNNEDDEKHRRSAHRNKREKKSERHSVSSVHLTRLQKQKKEKLKVERRSLQQLFDNSSCKSLGLDGFEDDASSVEAETCAPVSGAENDDEPQAANNTPPRQQQHNNHECPPPSEEFALESHDVSDKSMTTDGAQAKQKRITHLERHLEKRLERGGRVGASTRSLKDMLSTKKMDKLWRSTNSINSTMTFDKNRRQQQQLQLQQKQKLLGKFSSSLSFLGHESNDVERDDRKFSPMEDLEEDDGGDNNGSGESGESGVNSIGDDSIEKMIDDSSSSLNLDDLKYVLNEKMDHTSRTLSMTQTDFDATEEDNLGLLSPKSKETKFQNSSKSPGRMKRLDGGILTPEKKEGSSPPRQTKQRQRQQQLRESLRSLPFVTDLSDKGDNKGRHHNEDEGFTPMEDSEDFLLGCEDDTPPMVDMKLERHKSLPCVMGINSPKKHKSQDKRRGKLQQLQHRTASEGLENCWADRESESKNVLKAKNRRHNSHDLVMTLGRTEVSEDNLLSTRSLHSSSNRQLLDKSPPQHNKKKQNWFHQTQQEEKLREQLSVPSMSQHDLNHNNNKIDEHHGGSSRIKNSEDPITLWITSPCGAQRHLELDVDIMKINSKLL